MKIIRVCTILDFGGVEKRLVNIAQSCPSGIETIFIALGTGGWAANELQKYSKEVICLESDYRIPNLNLIFKLVKIFKFLKPDVVHTSGAEANFHAQIAAFIARVPKRVSEEIGFPNHNRTSRYIFGNVYKLSHKVVCISEAVANKVVQLGEAKKENIEVVYNPIAYNIYERQTTKTESPLRFVTVCRLTEIKNLARLIRVFCRFLDVSPGSVLQIVGDGPEKESLQKLVNDLSIDNSVWLEGFSQNPANFLLEADVFVLPSYSEGLGNAIMEAMLVGIPCIVSNIGGGRELIEDEINGWLINPYNDEEIFQKLVAASTTTIAKRESMGLISRKLIKDKFSSENHWKSLINIYRN